MIRLLLLLVLGFGTLPAAAQTPQPGWIADATTGCRVWNLNPEPKETISWSGACLDGLAQGQGVLQWFKDGQANGRFEGEFLDGRRNGRGVFTWANGARYEGGYSDDKQTGRGTLTWAKGDRYNGEWRDNKPNGHGTLTTADGTKYAGIWRNGCYEKRVWLVINVEVCLGG